MASAWFLASRASLLNLALGGTVSAAWGRQTKLPAPPLARSYACAGTAAPAGEGVHLRIQKLRNVKIHQGRRVWYTCRFLFQYVMRI